MKIPSDRFVLNKYGIFIKPPIWNNKFHLKFKAFQWATRPHQKSKHWYLIMLDIAAVCLDRSTGNFSGLLLNPVISRTNYINLRNANCNFSKIKSVNLMTTWEQCWLKMSTHFTIMLVLLCLLVNGN